MSNYLTTDQALDRLDRVKEIYQDADGVTLTSVLQDDIDQVEGEVDASLGMRYATPVTATAHVAYLRGIAVALLHEIGYTRMPSGTVPDGIAARAKMAREQLQRIADGKAHLAAATDNTTTSTGGTIVVSTNDPEMTRGKLKGF